MTLIEESAGTPGPTLLAEIRIPQENVEAMRPSDVSIMPKGLEKTMTPQEFSDLIDFLFQRR